MKYKTKKYNELDYGDIREYLKNKTIQNRKKHKDC